MDKSGVPVILIAEDDPCNYLLFEVILKKRYTLIHAWDGQEAVGLFREHRPDLVIMDIRMPGMNGYEATEAIRGISETVPIIAATAFSLEEDERKIRKCGCSDYITKPVDPHLLTSKIAFALGME